MLYQYIKCLVDVKVVNMMFTDIATCVRYSSYIDISSCIIVINRVHEVFGTVSYCFNR